jgi:hypothetical protein
MDKFELIGETKALAVHVVRRDACLPRVEVYWRGVSMMGQPLPPWASKVDGKEYRTNASARRAAHRVLAFRPLSAA